MPKKTTDSINTGTESIPAVPIKEDKVTPVSPNADESAVINEPTPSSPKKQEGQSWLIC